MINADFINYGEDYRKMVEYDNCPIGREVRLQMTGLSKDIQYIKDKMEDTCNRTDKLFDGLYKKLDIMTNKFAEKEQVKVLEMRINSLTTKVYSAIISALFSILLVVLTYFLNN